MSDGEEEATPEEKMRIATHFLMSSPPGQIKDVLADVRTLLPSGLLDDTVATNVFRSFNNEEMKIVDNGDHKMILCRDGAVDADHAIDTASGQVVGVNHLTQTVNAADAQPYTSPNAAVEPHRAAVQQTLNDYISTQYGTESVAAAAFGTPTGVKCVVSAEKLSLRNFWSGSWRSEFSCAINGSSAVVTGRIRLRIHYFEDGNVQMFTDKPSTDNISFTDAASFAAAVTGIIKTAEDGIQGSLEEMYSNMSDETFKEMRRVMPVTRTKMDWNVNAHKMVRNLRQ